MSEKRVRGILTCDQYFTGDSLQIGNHPKIQNAVNFCSVSEEMHFLWCSWLPKVNGVGGLGTKHHARIGTITCDDTALCVSNTA